jgi:hypothetical protein
MFDTKLGLFNVHDLDYITTHKKLVNGLTKMIICINELIY